MRDVALGNGVIGKVVVYNMEERQRIKIVDYVGVDNSTVDQGKIEEELKKRGINLRIDTFIDPGLIRQVTGIVREVYAEKGYQFADVKPAIKELPGGPKLVHLTFNVNEGPKVKIRAVQFVGNVKISDGKLEKQMKENKSKNWLSFIKGGGTFKEDKFEDDAELIIGHYRDEGYIAARVGQPQLKILEDENDGRTRWVELTVPISEGAQYKVGAVTFEGNTVVKSELLGAAVQAEARRHLQRQRRPQGLREGARAVRCRRLLRVHGIPRPQAARSGRDRRQRSDRSARSGGARRARRGQRQTWSAHRRRHDSAAGRQAVPSSTGSRSSATRRRGITSSGARSGSSRPASSTLKR